MDEPKAPASIEERQLRALLHAVDPARAACIDVSLDDDTLDALAIERAVQEIRRQAATRDGRSIGVVFTRLADRLERRQSQ